MSILLTHAYFLSEDKHEQTVMRPYPPLGILYLSSYLKAHGFDVQVFDTTFASREEFYQLVRTRQPAVLGIYCNLMTKLSALDLIAFAKSQGALVILGGPEPVSYPEEFLSFGADIIVVGEGEETVMRILQELERPHPRLQNVEGIIFRNGQTDIIRTPPRELIRDLDTLPFPDRDAIPLDRYLDTWRTYHGQGSVSLITARGCPYTCTWCSHGVYGFTHRRRTPANVVDEIEMILQRYHPDMLWFADDVFTIHHTWIKSFADEMRKRNLHIPFECISRADRLNEEVLRTMAQLGCMRIWCGSESGSQKILDAMSRGVTVGEIQQASRLANDAGIEFGLFVMFGYEGETKKDIAETVEHLKRTDASTLLTTVAYPIKGTTYYDRVRDRIVTSRPWHARTDRDLDVQGRYPKRFYWFAQRYLVNELKSHAMKRKGKSLFRRFPVAAKAALSHLGMEVTTLMKK